MTRICIRMPDGNFMLVPADPPLLAGDVEIDLSGMEIDLSGLTEDRVPVSRTITPRIDEVALAALLEASRKGMR